MKSKLVKNKKMNNEVFKLRQKVMDIIYDLKKDLDLPRITVRITDNNGAILGVGTMNEKVAIWITDLAFSYSYKKLYHVVAHEIGHAVYKLEHDEDCPLMKATVNKGISKKKILEVLKKAERNKNKSKKQELLVA